MNYNDLKSLKRLEFQRDVVLVAAKSVTKMVDPATGVSARDAFIAAFDTMSSQDVESICVAKVTDDMLARAARPELVIGSQMTQNPEMTAADQANTLTRLLIESGRIGTAQMDTLKTLILNMIKAGISIYKIISILADWLDGREKRPMGDVLRANGIDPEAVGVK